MSLIANERWSAIEPESAWSRFWKGVKNWFRKVGQAIVELFNSESELSETDPSSDDPAS